MTFHKKIRLILILWLLPLLAAAQFRFGYIHYNDVCRQMPQYAQAQQQLSELKNKYEQEATRSEEEFQRKFTDFIQGQKDFPANILQKRQAELQDVMERGIAFRQEAQALLDKAEADLMQDVYRQLNAAITAVAMEYGYAFVLNRDDNAAPFINPELGDDITELVRIRLGIVKPEELTPVVPAEGVPAEEVPQQVVPTDENGMPTLNVEE